MCVCVCVCLCVLVCVCQGRVGVVLELLHLNLKEGSNNFTIGRSLILPILGLEIPSLQFAFA